MKAAGLKGFSTHKLRHTAATLMYQTGNVDILTLKQLLVTAVWVQRKFIRICKNFRCVPPLSRTRWARSPPEKHAGYNKRADRGEQRGK